MSCIANSILVIAIASAIAWLAAALVYLNFDIQLPFIPWIVFYFICRQGFTNHSRIRTHCGWTTLGGGILGIMIFPQSWVAGGLSRADALFGMHHGFGFVNASLIGSATLMSLFALLECLNNSVDDISP